MAETFSSLIPDIGISSVMNMANSDVNSNPCFFSVHLTSVFVTQTTNQELSRQKLTRFFHFHMSHILDCTFNQHLFSEGLSTGFAIPGTLSKCNGGNKTIHLSENDDGTNLFGGIQQLSHFVISLHQPSGAIQLGKHIN